MLRKLLRQALVAAALVLLQAGSVSAASGAASARDQAAAAAEREYRVGPEDVLEISVWREEGLQKEVLVRPDGGISFPLAGDVDVAGKTVEEIARVLTDRVKAYIPGAVLTVSLRQIAGYRIYVLGKVNQPGQHTVGRYLDVMQALTLAGGLTPFASESNIKVLRGTGGDGQVFAFDYADVKRGRGLEQNILLRSGDVVVVP